MDQKTSRGLIAVTIYHYDDCLTGNGCQKPNIIHIHINMYAQNFDFWKTMKTGIL